MKLLQITTEAKKRGHQYTVYVRGEDLATLEQSVAHMDRADVRVQDFLRDIIFIWSRDMRERLQGKGPRRAPEIEASALDAYERMSKADLAEAYRDLYFFTSSLRGVDLPRDRWMEDAEARAKAL